MLDLLVVLVLVGVVVFAIRLRARLAAGLARERELRSVAEDRERRLRRVLEGMAEGFLTVDAEWRLRYINPQGETLLGATLDELFGQNLWEAYPEAQRSNLFAQVRSAMRDRVPVEFEEVYPPANRWFEVRAYPADDGGLTVFFRDVTGQRSARRFAELSQKLLADSGAALAATLDVGALLGQFAAVVVPAFADGLVTAIREDDGSLQRLEPFDVEGRLASVLPPGVEHDETVRRVAETGIGAHSTPTRASPGLQAALGELGGGSALTLPLHAGARKLGAMTFFSREPDRFTGPEQRLAGELANRAAFAIDNLRLYEAALLASRAKSDFLAVMSHELRTPLTTIMGYTDLLLSGLPEPLSDTAHRYIDRVRLAAWHLLAIIEQILIYTRLEVGTEQMQLERVSAADLLHETASLIEPVAREQGLDFVVISPAEPIELQADLTKLRQILLNLLSNAVRFTDEGRVELSVAVEQGAAVFRVSDTGIGIAPEHHERIFEPFWQVDQSATRRVGGTGLGLSVARRLARMLGGNLEVESAPASGSTFRLRVPLFRSTASPRNE